MDIFSLSASALFFWGVGGIILLLILSSGLFSGSETALTTASRAKLHSRAAQGDTRAAHALALTENKERLIGAILLGNNLVNILATSLATMLFTSLLGDSGVAVATLVMTALVLVFAEVLPKTYAIANAEKMACRVASTFKIIVLVFSPVVSLVQIVVRAILGLIGVNVDPQRSIYAAQEEIAGAINLHHREGAVGTYARDRLLGTLDLHLRWVEEVMTHRRNMETIDADTPEAEIIAQVLASSYTRIPVYRGDPDNIIGVLHTKDLTRWMNSDEERGNVPKVLDIMMPPYFIPESARLDDQILQFLKRKTHIALVVDEYGAIRGIVTLEDILEEIVGEIMDEHDLEEPAEFATSDDGSVEVSGDMSIRGFNRLHDFALPDDGAVTLAGLVIRHAEAIPPPGAVFQIAEARIEILESDGMRVTRLRVRARAHSAQDE